MTQVFYVEIFSNFTNIHLCKYSLALCQSVCWTGGTQVVLVILIRQVLILNPRIRYVIILLI